MSEPHLVTKRAMESGEPVFRKIGVGPWKDEHPDLPRPDNRESPNFDPRFDTELLDLGDTRNVLDKYRYWTVAAIKADLDMHGRHSFEVAIENWTHDFNIGSIVRTANAFQASRVNIIGPHKWNRKGSLMTELYQDICHYGTIEDLVHAVRERDKTDGHKTQIVAMDIVPGAQPIEKYNFQKRSLLLFGAEGPGLSQKALEMADDVVYISQFGSVRSINAGAAAAVAMHAWISQNAQITAE